MAEQAIDSSSKSGSLYDKEALVAAMQCLNATQQEILELFVEGHSIAEIAEQLRLSPARVSDQKYKAIRTLKSQLFADSKVVA